MTIEWAVDLLTFNNDTLEQQIYSHMKIFPSLLISYSKEFHKWVQEKATVMNSVLINLWKTL